MQEKFLENLVDKMIKAIHNKNDSAFVSLKTVFTKNIEKEEIKKLLSEFDNYFYPIKEVQDNKENFNLDFFKNAIKVDKCARAIETRWCKLSSTQKAKFANIKSKNIDIGYKYSAQKFANTFEDKRLNLQKNGISVSREAYYELIALGYKAENISRKDQSYTLPVLGKKTKLVFASENEFYEYLKKHENNFNSDISRVMEC